MPHHYPIKPGPAPTRPMPHGDGQGPLPDPDKHLKPLKKADRGLTKAPKKHYG